MRYTEFNDPYFVDEVLANYFISSDLNNLSLNVDLEDNRLKVQRLHSDELIVRGILSSEELHSKLNNKIYKVAIFVRGRNADFPPTAYIRLLLTFNHPSLKEKIVPYIIDEDKLDGIKKESFLNKKSYDCIIVQRDLLDESFANFLVQKCKEHNITLIYEIDDDLLNIDRTHPEYLKYLSKSIVIKYLIENADLVTVSTNLLKTKLEDIANNVICIPNALDESLWCTSNDSINYDHSFKDNKIVKIGYMGSFTHQRDLKIIKHAIKNLKKKFADNKVEIKFEIIGGMDSDDEWVNRIEIPDDNRTYPKFVKWLKETVDWDIAIAPLANTNINKSKSEIKYLEYTGLGLAGVYSNIGPYKEVIKDGYNGLLVKNDNSNEWEEQIYRLLTDKNLQDNIKLNAQKDVKNNYLIKYRAEQWFQIIKNLVNNNNNLSVYNSPVPNPSKYKRRYSNRMILPFLKVHNSIWNDMFKNNIKKRIRKTSTYRVLEIEKNNLLSEKNNLILEKNNLEDKVQKLSSDNVKLNSNIKVMKDKTQRVIADTVRLNNYINVLKDKTQRLNQEKIILNDKLLSNRHFKDLSGFLAESLLSPLLQTPFQEEDKRCFAIMENVAKYLIGRANETENTELVSIIMPVYNSVDVLEFAVDSILGQTYQNFELIIVDDGSDDGSNELLNKFNDDRIIILKNESCQGLSKARNRALESVSGKYIMYLNPDSIWDPRYISTMIGAFKELPDAEALYSGQLLFKDNSQHPYAVLFGSYNRSLLTNKNYIDINAFCHRNNIYKRIGGFDENLNHYMGWDWIMRISESVKMYSIPVLLSYKYIDTDVTINDNKSLLHNLDTVRKKHIEREIKSYNPVLNSINKLNIKISIIIPNYESLDDIRDCINSILTLPSNEMLEIIVVDNASDQQTVDYLSQLKNENKIKFIQNNINYGFTYAVNQGIAISELNNDIIIMNNDTILTPGCIEAMQKAAYELPQCGLIVPQQVLPGGTNSINTHVPYADPKYDCDVNLSIWHSNITNVPLFHSGNVLELSFAPFFFVYIKRDVLNSSVGLDPELGRHYRSDRIFCDYIRHVMNLKIYYVADAIVYHKLQKSTEFLREISDKNSNFDMMLQKNQWDEELKAKLGYKTPVWDI